MTKEGHQSFILDEPIQYVVPLQKEVQTETIDSEDSDFGAVVISSDEEEDEEKLSAERRMQRAERAKRRKELNEMEIDRLEKEWKKRAATKEKKRQDRLRLANEQTEAHQESGVIVPQVPLLEDESLGNSRSTQSIPADDFPDLRKTPRLDSTSTVSSFSIEDVDIHDASDDLGTIIQNQHKHFPLLTPLQPLSIPSTTITTFNTRKPKNRGRGLPLHSHFGLTYYDWWTEYGRREDGGMISKLALALETIAVSEVDVSTLPDRLRIVLTLFHRFRIVLTLFHRFRIVLTLFHPILALCVCDIECEERDGRADGRSTAREAELVGRADLVVFG
ncbi:hypothetical protein BLNAU_19981 [Blattamonas nauphoetae]|uniref:Uncharacterized protein n=1 Tax=Blattamonas nauphoetae TaxID=2049346 RepID=A0ABQ9WZZ2_9EUKA|nr:hypothetical protein BLNAU_19981 [Blattamonas nauphoetae]